MFGITLCTYRMVIPMVRRLCSCTVQSLARELVWVVSYAIFAQSSYFECITYLQRARFVIKNRTVLAQVTSVLLCVMCSVCFGSFGNRGIAQIVGVVSNIPLAERSKA